MMEFQRYRPTRLPGLVAQIWEQRCATPRRWRILPSGWVELLFRLGPPFSLREARVLEPDAAPIRPFCFLSGLHTGPLDLTFESFHMLGVRLHPVAVRALFGIPCSEVRDGAVDGALLLDDVARIEDGLRSAADFGGRARWLEAELGRRLWNAEGLETAERMRELARRLPIGAARPARALQDRLGYSRTHAHRLFREWLGQSATGAIRLARFVRATATLHTSSDPLTQIGYRAGYYDQPHFIREFRAFSGMTPGEYRRRAGGSPEQLSL